jgi:hypothetical protein
VVCPDHGSGASVSIMEICGARTAFDLHQVGELDDARARLRRQVRTQLGRPRHGRGQADAHVTRCDGVQTGEVQRQQVAALGGASAHAAHRG